MYIELGKTSFRLDEDNVSFGGHNSMVNEVETPFLVKAEEIMSSKKHEESFVSEKESKANYDLTRKFKNKANDLQQNNTGTEKNTPIKSPTRQQQLSVQFFKPGKTAQELHSKDLTTKTTEQKADTTQSTAGVTRENKQSIAVSAAKNTGKLPKLSGFAPKDLTPKSQNKILNNGISNAAKTIENTRTFQPVKNQVTVEPESARIKNLVDSREFSQALSKSSTDGQGEGQKGQSNDSGGNRDEGAQRSFEKYIRSSTVMSQSAGADFTVQNTESSESETPTKAQNMAEVTQAVLEQVERFKKMGSNNLRVTLQLPDGDKLGVRLSLNGRDVRVKFLTGSPEIRKSLEDGWKQLSSDAEARGVSLSTPEFEEDAFFSGQRQKKQNNSTYNNYA